MAGFRNGSRIKSGMTRRRWRCLVPNAGSAAPFRHGSSGLPFAMAPGVRRYNRQIVVDWSPLANAPHPEDDEVARFAANRQRGATFEVCTEIGDLRRQPTRSSSSGLTRGSMPDHRSRIRISEGTPHRRHAPFPVWLLISLVLRPFDKLTAQDEEVGSGRMTDVSGFYFCDACHAPVRCSCPEYLGRGHPAFAPGCCPLVALRSFRLRTPGSPLNQEAKTQLPVGPELGAHRPAAPPQRCRSGTDRCPDARSAHPFPAQRYLRGRG